MADEPRSGCPNNAAAEVLGSRWSRIVLRDVMFGALASAGADRTT